MACHRGVDLAKRRKADTLALKRGLIVCAHGLCFIRFSFYVLACDEVLP